MDIIAAMVTTLFIALANPVFRCETPGQPPLFSDLPCPHGTLLHLQPAPLIQSVGTPPGDSLSDIAGIDAVKQRRNQPAGHRTARVSKADRCQTARTGLRGVQMKKRKGYSLAEAAQLEAEQREFKDEIRASCW